MYQYGESIRKIYHDAERMNISQAKCIWTVGANGSGGLEVIQKI